MSKIHIWLTKSIVISSIITYIKEDATIFIRGNVKKPSNNIGHIFGGKINIGLGRVTH